MIARREWLILPLLLIAACAHRPDSDVCVAPAAGIRYCLLPPAALPANSAPRLVHIVAPDMDRHLVAQMGVDNGTLVFAASSLLGQPLFAIHYSRDADGQWQVETRPGDVPVRATWLLAMLQIALSDPAAVSAAMSGAQLESSEKLRRVLRGERVLMEIRTGNGAVHMALPEQELQIDIEALPNGPELQ